MPTLIDRHGRVADRWVAVDRLDRDPPMGAWILVGLQDWRTDSAAWTARAGRVGVELSTADDPAELAGDLDRLSLIAVRFPAFTDGRGYSIARLLRDRYRWTGELRAVGDVLRDQLLALARCGFDTFALADDVDASRALTAFGEFDERYQADAQGAALFERRFGPAAHGPALPVRECASRVDRTTFKLHEENAA